MLSLLKLLNTLLEICATILPLVDNGIQVWNAISINNTNFSTDVIHERLSKIELRPTLSKCALKSYDECAFMGQIRPVKNRYKVTNNKVMKIIKLEFIFSKAVSDNWRYK